MIEKKLKAMEMKEIQVFNHICSKCDCEVDLRQGKYYVNAKSIMGIFSLDMSKEIELVVDTDNEDYVVEQFGDFIDK